MKLRLKDIDPYELISAYEEAAEHLDICAAESNLYGYGNKQEQLALKFAASKIRALGDKILKSQTNPIKIP